MMDKEPEKRTMVRLFSIRWTVDAIYFTSITIIKMIEETLRIFIQEFPNANGFLMQFRCRPFTIVIK